MLVVAVAVHEDDRDRAEAVIEACLEIRARPLDVERMNHLTVRSDALLHLDDLGVEQLRQHDVSCEDLGTVLVGNAQLIAKATRNEEHSALALALSSALVATVVPIFTASIAAAWNRGIGATPSKWRMPAMAASR